jgi:hypothetical protein
MNDMLIKLFTIAANIKKDGWIVIPPSNRKYTVTLRVEWFLDKKYGFERSFTRTELEQTNIDLAAVFVEEANHNIDMQLKQSA